MPWQGSHAPERSSRPDLLRHVSVRTARGLSWASGSHAGLAQKGVYRSWALGRPVGRLRLNASFGVAAFLRLCAPFPPAGPSGSRLWEGLSEDLVLSPLRQSQVADWWWAVAAQASGCSYMHLAVEPRGQNIFRNLPWQLHEDKFEACPSRVPIVLG